MKKITNMACTVRSGRTGRPLLLVVAKEAEERNDNSLVHVEFKGNLANPGRVSLRRSPLPGDLGTARQGLVSLMVSRVPHR